ncbi:MAG TPA: hypothetical protein VF828_02330 [Patescibacteria group bacterium]
MINKRLPGPVFSGIFCIAVLFGILGKPVLAQSEGLNIVTSPLPINLVTEPGSTVSAQLKVKNGGQETENLKISLMKFTAFGEEGKPRLLDRERGDDYFDWIKFSEDNFELRPNEWKTITATITVPQNAAFGYYYAVVFSRKQPEEKSSSNAIVGATASLVLLEVRVPQAIRDIEVLDFSTDKGIYEFLPANFSIRLKNKGNVHVAPRGNIFIDSMNKKDVAILEINDVRGNVLPGTNRIFDSQWNDGFPVYQYKTDGNKVLTDKKFLNWDFSKISNLRIGKYTAHMLLVYDDGQRDVPIEGTLSFWVMPWRIIGAALVVFLLVGTGIWSMIRNILIKIWPTKK